MIRTEVAVLPEDDNNALAVQVRQTREQLGEKFRGQAEQLQKLEQDLINRSRQTFEQRFGKTVGKQFDYFHDELVGTLAGNDPPLLGSDYPGPSA